jgi:hypothetical protein
LLIGVLSSIAPAFAAQTITLKLEDYSYAPHTGGVLNGGTGNTPYAARLNFLRDEPGSTGRYVINDLMGQLYFFDPATKAYTLYLNFDGTGTRTGLFDKLAWSAGYAGGFGGFQFHPEYRQADKPHYGVFYTMHLEDPVLPGSLLPDTAGHPGLDATGYTPTPVVIANGPETALRHSVVIEWKDTDPTDAVFTGTAREIMRVEVNNRLHPIGDFLFNPLAFSSSHPDYGNLYITSGDGGDGETNQVVRHANPQDLSQLVGKILRINPDDPDGAGPLTYSIPADNPFVATPGARGEIWAYGFRNPHRFFWDIFTNKLIVNDIGFHAWEEVNIVKKGGNYAWADREGAHTFDVVTDTTGPLPANDAEFGYEYPVLEYPHKPTPGYASFGDAVTNGFVYRGLKFPFLFGKYLTGDITTGELYAADYSDMLAADDGVPTTLAPFIKIKIEWDNPLDADTTPESYERMFEVCMKGYQFRGGPAGNLPGTAANSGTGRADIRWAWDSSGEIYLLSKSDGTIRRVVGLTASPVFEIQPHDATVRKNRNAIFGSLAFGAPMPTFKWQRAEAGSSTFVDLVDNQTYAGTSSPILVVRDVKTAMSGDQFRLVATNEAGTETSSAATLTVTN